MFCPSSNLKAPTRITLSQGQTPLKVEGLVPRSRDILCLCLGVNVAFGGALSWQPFSPRIFLQGTFLSAGTALIQPIALAWLPPTPTTRISEMPTSA